jgi:hypothetical protein
MHRYAGTVANGEREADALRRKVMDGISKGELSPIDREDLMGLVKKGRHGCRLEPRVNTNTRRHINGTCPPVNQG